MKYIPILLFYLIAVLISNLFRFDILEINQLLSLPWSIEIAIRSLLEGSGIILAFLAVWLFFKQSISQYWDKPQLKDVLLLAVPIVLYAFIGVENSRGGNSHMDGLIVAASIMGYCFIEEMAWRSYFHKELSKLNKSLRYLIIGVIWYLWHLSFLSSGTFNMIQEIQYLVIFILASFALGTVVEKKQSIYPAVFLHFLVNTITFSNVLNTVPMNYKIGIAVTSFVTWFLLDKFFISSPKTS
ncbi:CPBP family intramembrane metalloprotease [Marivirga sp. S37H4]|uniref:CPBP family intramembrane metalloprotease n=1 Tax=Marivirga aurantiaca TaxID=2802615 RepID=A0A934WYN7_9BACT|nr:CPBP family intramembrane glutamic endopeptidase [Marivirga aurantiaca]MBK6265322.1 CPBP family intramembrane metalloprotease [Marivirga aurantiaca]